MPSFRPAIALAISAIIAISLRLVLVMRCGMLSRASWSISPGTLSSFWKCSLHLATSLSCYQRRSPLHLLISGEQVPSSWVPTLPSVHCRSLSCRFCQQVSAAPLPSFPTSLTSVHGCVFCSWQQASLYAAVADIVLLVCNTLCWGWSLLIIRVCSSWSLGSHQSWWFLSGLPIYVFAVLYTTCCTAAHSSSGFELSFSSHWARALSISCSNLSLRLWYLVLVYWGWSAFLLKYEVEQRRPW